MAADGSDAKGALESFTNAFKPDKTGSAIGGAVSGQGKEKPGVSVGCLVCTADAWQICMQCLIPTASAFAELASSCSVHDCVQDASSQVVESIKISQSGKANEAESLADKFSKVCP